MILARNLDRDTWAYNLQHEYLAYLRNDLYVENTYGVLFCIKPTHACHQALERSTDGVDYVSTEHDVALNTFHDVPCHYSRSRTASTDMTRSRGYQRSRDYPLIINDADMPVMKIAESWVNRGRA